MAYFIIGLLALAALAAVAWPFFRKPATDVVLTNDAALEEMIRSYRSALAAGTVCDKCLRDNPNGSNYCADCGAALQK